MCCTESRLTWASRPIVRIQVSELTINTSKETAMLSMERVMAAHPFKKASKDMARIIVESQSDCIYYKPHPPGKFVFKPLFGIRSEIERILAALGAVLETDAEAIVRSFLTK